MSADINELESLWFDWESGTLDESGIERLREILKSDPSARSQFVQMQMMSAALQLDNEAGLGLPLDAGAQATSMAASPSTRLRGQLRTPSFWIALAASLLVCVLGSWLVYSQVSNGSSKPIQSTELETSNDHESSQEATARGVALLTRLVDVTWGDNQPAVEAGAALSPGRFAIKAGHAQVEFFCGATIVLEGPAELELESATLAKVHRGRLRAHVPPAARGFSLEVGELTVVDLGTEFGLSVSPGGASIQVFEGEVELQRPANKTVSLKTGEAVAQNPAGELQATQATPESFVDIADLESRTQLQRSARYQRWLEWSTQLRRDPRLIAYYGFDNQGDGERRLECSLEPVNHELDGAIVGARQVGGRWRAKQALEFKQPADRVRVQIPGEYGSLTLACWVKIDSLDRWYNSLFLTDGYDQGEPHWQILDNGQAYFSVRPFERGAPGLPDYKALSPSFWEPSLNGKWIHLAVTCDLDANVIVHYLNGNVLSRHVVPPAQMPKSTRVGAASLGNWALPTLPDSQFAIRNLNGSIDEFAIFAAALSADEIKEMYEHGKP